MKLYIIIFFNIIRIAVYRIRYGSRFHCHPVQRIHRSVDISLYGRNSSIALGRNLEICDDSELWCFGDATISIGDGTYANKRLTISCHSGVTIGRGCMFGPDVKIFDNDHAFTKEKGVSSELKKAPILIGNNCWIASNAVILRGTTIGDNSIIGAGCIVKGNIPANSIMKLNSQGYTIEEIR